MAATAYPLTWPSQFPRAKAREKGAFKTTLAGAREGVFITAADVNSLYRRRATEVHPDKGGTDSQMAELNAARDEALQELGNG